MRSESRRPSRIRLILTRLFQVFVVLCLIDGFVDIAYPGLRAAKAYVTAHIFPPRHTARALPIPEEELVLPPDLGRRREPGISGIASEYHSPRLNVSAEGLRSNGQPAPENAHGYALLLGSSVGFGAGVADNKTLAAQLERTLNDVRIENYAGLAQSVPESTLRWYDVQTRSGKPEFVIIAGANLQLYRDCREPPPPADKLEHKNVMLFLADRLWGRTPHQVGEELICTTDKSREMAVRSSIMAIENTIAFAHKQGVPLYIVYLPTPYDRKANTQNLMALPDYRSQVDTMQKMHMLYHAELMKLGLPEVIDLSDALPADKMYFLDIAGHLSAEGNRIIAERLAEILRTRTKSQAL